MVASNFSKTDKLLLIGALVFVLLSVFFMFFTGNDNEIRINYVEFRDSEEDVDFAYSLTNLISKDIECDFTLSYYENETIMSDNFSVTLLSKQTKEGIHNLYLPDGENNVSVKYDCSIM